MIVSWNWLQDYVKLAVSPDEFVRRLAMTGLNHESTTPVEQDWAIDLEVTSNRRDCLGHLGVAREASVVFQRELCVPDPRPTEGSSRVADQAKVTILCPDLCPRYTARIVRGIRVSSSPDWLVRRLRTIGVTPVNNVVDITNYVMFECGQPLHAFDAAHLLGSEIIVREALPGEEFLAIDHRTYRLQSGMCVIADAKRSVALGGVMGGADSEISSRTRDVLIEAAAFAPLSVRTTARALALHSPSSYRFERGVDQESIDWASRRCCQLILECAGGELIGGVLDLEPVPRPPARPIRLRVEQIPRLLGIDVPRSRIREILGALGLRPVETAADGSGHELHFTPPSWRSDLTREVDLIEEVARIHGYDQIPEDVAVPMAPSARTDPERVIARTRQVLVAAGFHEAMTASIVPIQSSEAFSPWTSEPALRTQTPLLRGADYLRRSLVPSLLTARRENERQSLDCVELFETAKVYLPGNGPSPDEPTVLAITSGRSFLDLKGVLQSLLAAIARDIEFQAIPYKSALLTAGKAVELRIHDRSLGFLGEVSADGMQQFELLRPTTVAEIRLDALQSVAKIVPQFRAIPEYPVVERDFNLVLAEAVTWDQLRRLATTEGAPLLELVTYRETYRDPERDGRGHKRVLFSLRFRSAHRTLTSDEIDAVCQRIVQSCAEQLGARLLA